MPGEAQIRNNRPLAARCIFSTFVFITLLMLPETAYANRVVASSGFKNMLYLCISLPIFAAICAYLVTVWQKEPGLRAQRFIFLFFALAPALFFYAAITLETLSRNNLSIRMIEQMFMTAGFLSLVWFGAHYTVYGIYSHMMDMPRPFLFRWVTRKRLLILFTIMFTIAVGYIYYPKAYFHYHVLKGNAGHIESQLWLGKTHEVPRTKKPLGDRAYYTEQNYFKARDWYEKAAAQGNSDAYIELAQLYGGMKGGFASHGGARTAWQREVDLKTARYWAQKAADAGRNPDLLAKIEKMIADRTPVRNNFADMSGSPVYASSGFSNLLSTICWLLGMSFLNIGLFIGIYKIYRKMNPRAARHYQRFITLAATWPTILILPPALIAAAFERRAMYVASIAFLLTTFTTVCFALVLYNFLKRAQRKSEEQREKYAFKLAAIYWLVGLLFIAFPFVQNAVSNWIVRL